MPALYREKEVGEVRSRSPHGRTRPAAADLAARRALVRFHTDHPWARHSILTCVSVCMGILLVGYVLYFAMNDEVHLGLLLAIILPQVAAAVLFIWRDRRLKALFLEELDNPGTLCPRCGYDMRALTTSTCPECGHDIALTAVCDTEDLP